MLTLLFVVSLALPAVHGKEPLPQSEVDESEEVPANTVKFDVTVFEICNPDMVNFGCIPVIRLPNTAQGEPPVVQNYDLTRPVRGSIDTQKPEYRLRFDPAEVGLIPTSK